MATVDETRRKTEADASDAAGLIDSLLATLGQAVDTARKAESGAKQVISDLGELQKADALPMEFTGVIYDYRFGMIDVGIPERSTSKSEKVKPFHRFEVEIPGQGLWLHVRVTSDKFDEFLATTDIKNFEGAKSLNGKTVTIRRDTKAGCLVPIGFGITTAEVNRPLGKDKSGNDLFRGDQVSIRSQRSYYERTFRATILDFDGKAWTIQRKDRKQPSRLSALSIKSYRRFEKVT